MKKILLFVVLIFATMFFGYKVTFVVEVPDYTPKDSKLHVAGNFNGWNPGDVNYQLRKEENIFVGTFDFSGKIEFKFTRGSWESVEKGAKGEEIPNRILEVNSDVTLNVKIYHWRDFVEKQMAGLKSTYTGNIKLIKDFYSPELNNSRNIIIYLPPNYDSSNERYPVLYMHDGQNIFDASTSFSGIEWSADETTESFIKEGLIKPIIIVGIYNMGNDRRNEYSPWVDKSYGGGKGDLYAEFIVKTLKPYIDKNFRTLPDRDNTAIAGSSLGGLISLYIGFKYNDVFSKVSVMSPAFWFADKKIFDFVTFTEVPEPTKIYMDVGTQESSNPEIYVIDARNMYKLLQKKTNVQIVYMEDQGAIHSESAWAKRFPELLLYFFEQ
ncbi:MAG: alpha/beta hydrolase-fold protein [Fervidobacterium sp.]